MAEINSDVWSVTNKILAVAGAAISLLITAVAILVLLGFNAQDARRVADNTVLLNQMGEIKEVAKATNNVLLKMVQDVSRIDANQLERMNRERDERYRGKR